MSERAPLTGAASSGIPILDEGPLARWLAPSSQSRVEHIAVVNILPRPIADHDDGDTASFAALIASMDARGIVEPLLLRPATGVTFVVVCGARRLRAARRLGLTTVPAIVRELGDVETLLTGAWQALLRFGIAPGEMPDLEHRLIAGGLHRDEAAALVAAIPRRPPSTSRPVGIDGAESRAPVLRFLRVGMRPGGSFPQVGPRRPPLAPPPGLLLPASAGAVQVLAKIPLPRSARHMAA